MDTLILKDCRFDCIVGVFPGERKTRQPLILDIELSVDAKRAARKDALKDALDYCAVHEAVKKHLEGSRRFLIETLAEEIAALILEKFPVSAVALTVKKPKPMHKRRGAWVGVRIVRSRARRAL